MSRTIVHIPSEVAILTGTARLTERHDHRDGICAAAGITEYKERYGSGYHGFGCAAYAWKWDFPCGVHFADSEWRRFVRTGPPKDYRRLGYEKPARQKARRQLHAVAQEFNSIGEVITEVEPYRTRHRASWDWS